MAGTAPASESTEAPGPSPAAAQPQSRLRTFESLKDPAFAWFFLSTLGMMGAVMMQILVRGFLVFELTGSFAALGVLSLVSAIPQLVFGFYGGVLADRFPKKLVVQIGQTVGFLNVFTMGLLAAFDVLAFWHLLASGMGSGLLIGLMVPARQAMVHEVVRGARMMNAISLNTAATNLMAIAAPAAGGIVLRAWGADGAFFVMSASYAIAILAIIPVPWASAAQQGESSFRAAVRDVVDGLRYVSGHRELRPILVFSFLTALLGSAYMPVLPGFVSEVFSDDASVLGLLLAVSAVGALIGSLVLASLPERRRGQLLVGSTIVLGAGLVGLSFSPLVWVALPFMVVIGLAQAARQSVGNTLLLVYSEETYHGRIMSLFMLQFAVMSLGAFGIGVLASFMSIVFAFAIVSLVLLGYGLASLGSRALVRIE